MALNEPVEIENNLDTTPVAEQEQVGEVEQQSEASDQGPTETTGENPKKGLESRVQELNAAKKAAEQKAASLEARVAELTRQGEQQFDYNQTSFAPDKPIVEPGEELSVDELNRRVAERDQNNFRKTDALIQLRTKQSESLNRINNEANESIRSYPELDPESESFNQELSDTITEAVENAVKVNPYSTSVKAVVAKQMKLYKGAVAQEVGQATENIAKQVSQAALRPSSIRQPEKTANDKSIEELEAELGIVQS